MKFMKASEIRRAFLEFFHERGHTIVKSSSLVPHDDPTLLFTNAGMVQFKRCFLGEEDRGYRRATSSQKCMRAGGKHNDLENVGQTARHHTFFEMLGNFSFGDYFKEEAIQFAWDFLVGVLGLPPEKLYATVHEGDEVLNIGPDDEARKFWARYLPEDRILAFPTKDNFWAMGDTGPCGPCSEILIDQGEEMGCGRPECAPGCDCDRYLELWNLVFMQFNRKEDGAFEPLPKPSIDTGMGLERIAAVVQGVPSNYDTDLFTPIISYIEEISGHAHGKDSEKDVSIKVIADHSRAAAFLIGDGILPSNEGRGYVLRRVIRRALRHGRFLGLDKPFLHKTVVAVMESMQDAYPELMESKSFITKVVLNEEERFTETLDYGLRLLNNEIKRLEELGEKTIPGDLIFKLYDTYGFPIDIITDLARDKGFDVDHAGFEERMEKQREQSRKHWKGSGERELDPAYRKLGAKGTKTTFLGYEQLTAKSKVVALVKDGELVDEARAGEQVELVTEETPFYGEAGGQVGDKGIIKGDNFLMHVIDTLKLPGDLIVHVGEIKEGIVRTDEEVELVVDKELREDTARNHTATHLLHAALREVLGDHVKQAGSLVSPKGFRFDLTHFAAITPEEIRKIEEIVNQRIRENIPLETRIMTMEEAIKAGAIALFEEKYGEKVRLVQIADVSKELCGGTHTSRTGDIGLFLIVHETSVAAGVRRIEAITGREAVAYVQKQRECINDLCKLIKTSPQELSSRVNQLLEQQKKLEKELEALKASLSSKKTFDLMDNVREIKGLKVLVTEVDADSPKILREMMDKLKQKIKSGVVILGAKGDGKVMLIAGVTDDLVAKISANDLIKKMAAIVGGGGGGRPDMAQAGGSKPEKLSEALDASLKLVEEMAS